MGVLDFIAAGYLAKRAHNKLNPPTIIVPEDHEIVSVKSRGLSEYEIRYKKKSSPSTSLMVISRSTKTMSGGWIFNWD